MFLIEFLKLDTFTPFQKKLLAYSDPKCHLWVQETQTNRKIALIEWTVPKSALLHICSRLIVGTTCSDFETSLGQVALNHSKTSQKMSAWCCNTFLVEREGGKEKHEKLSFLLLFISPQTILYI